LREDSIDNEAEHKIQSTKGSLTLEMDQVPKVLKPLVAEWIPEGYIVSFKVGIIDGSRWHQLETDDTLLVPKSRAALKRYGHQLVIGNNLVRRKFEVVFVEPKGDDYEETWLRVENEAEEIEKRIVDELVVRHERWLQEGSTVTE
jgi:phosphopantothenate-cysteine ligase